MMNTRRLLVLDKHRNTEEVLKAVFEPSGTQVTRVNSWQQLQNCEPSREGTVLVLHDNNALTSPPETDQFPQTPRIVIGRAEIKEGRAEIKENSSDSPPCPGSSTNLLKKEHQLDDLFEFNDLLHAIESLWKIAS